MSAHSFSRITILGVGQLGSSLGLALKQAGIQAEITGYDPHREHMQVAKDLGAIQKTAVNVEEAVDQSELIFCCSPLGSMQALFEQIGDAADMGAIVSDVSSVKGPLLTLARQHMPHQYFVAGHPIAGIEKSGPHVADANLFRHKSMLFTPPRGDIPPAWDRVELLWQSIGAHTSRLDPGLHDDIFGMTSHLAQLIAYLYSTLLFTVNPMPHLNRHFYRFIRIGGSDTIMWSDVFRFNHSNLMVGIYSLRESLNTLQEKLETPKKLTTWLADIHKWRAEARPMADEDEWQSPSLPAHPITEALPVALAYAYVHAVMEAETRIAQPLKEHLGAGFMGVTRPAMLAAKPAAELLTSLDMLPLLSGFRTGLHAMQHGIQEASESGGGMLLRLLNECKHTHMLNVERVQSAPKS